ncbi:MAG: acetyl-CoA carboxylase biotin carboxylase subunit [Spirochaetes bacterium]|nr:acetyl-CoA carboxylase biotin carboxylase subunit [Spirochaetota bacterium]
MIKKVLIANRGEIALRVIRACKELGLKTVSVHSTADEKSLHRSFADQDVCIGEPASADSYLNITRIIAAAEITGADAIHPGYGFLSERARFSEACAEAGINFIGPTKQIIEMMGDKATARETMKKAGVPIIPGTGILTDVSEAIAVAKKVKYPVILKATAGGGGRGMRICENDDDLRKFFEIASNEALNAFGNAGMYMEKYIRNPHHIEVQILGDKQGNVIHLGERDCSIQRKHQKLIEESPSPFISEKIRKKIREAAVRGAKESGYFGAGTMEFLVDDNGDDFFFIEMNTRIQVEHTVSEMITGVDLVKAQIQAADGLPLPFAQKDLDFRGHCIELRINAEDPSRDFMPNPGRLTGFHMPQGLGVRVDTHCYVDYTIPQNYDSMIAKLICWGRDRSEAIARCKRCLDEFVIDGIKTTIPFHKRVMDDKTFIEGKASTGFLATFKF